MRRQGKTPLALDERRRRRISLPCIDETLEGQEMSSDSKASFRKESCDEGCDDSGQESDEPLARV